MKKALFAAGGLMAAVAPAAASHLNEFGIAGDAAEIRRIVSGKTCLGSNGSVLNFGISAPGSPGTFARAGRIPGTYQIGYGTLLIKRGSELHSHVVSVSVNGSQLHLGGESFRC